MPRRALVLMLVGASTFLACGGAIAPDDGTGGNGASGASCVRGSSRYADGTTFPSGDGCNFCSCSNGVARCSLAPCGGSGVGSSSGTTTDPACPADVLICADGSAVVRQLPACNFPKCPSAPPPPPPPPPPPIDAGPANPTCEALASDAQDRLLEVIEANAACSKDADCELVPFSSGCFDACTRAISAKGASYYSTVRNFVNRSTCKTFQENGCTFAVPPCAPPQPPSCVNKRCQ